MNTRLTYLKLNMEKIIKMKTIQIRNNTTDSEIELLKKCLKFLDI